MREVSDGLVYIRIKQICSIQGSGKTERILVLYDDQCSGFPHHGVLRCMVLGLYHQEIKLGVLEAIYYVMVLLPTLAVTVRRLHDCNRSGWWILISILPVVGILILLLFLLQEGNVVVNQFGPTPKIDYLP
ncbi:DUF805 domain-containing protein [Vibrio sp. PP-XX7]